MTSPQARPLIVFAPGAGAPSSSPWMVDWAARLAELGDVWPFDYFYQEAGRRAPDRLPKLISAHREAIAAARAAHPQQPLLLAGKSMGGRIGCHVSLELKDERVAGLVCFGYPLKPPGKDRPPRDEVLLALSAPILFVQGTRDPFSRDGSLHAVLPRMTTRRFLHEVPGGGHSLTLSKSLMKQTGDTQKAADAAALAAVARFVAEVT